VKGIKKQGLPSVSAEAESVAADHKLDRVRQKRTDADEPKRRVMLLEKVTEPTTPDVAPTHPADDFDAKAPATALTGQARTAIALTPSLNAGLAIANFSTRCGPLKVIEIAHSLRAQMDQVAGGKLDRQEATLVAQSHTLDALFTHLLQRAADAEYVHVMEAYMRLALKTQSQCRTTIETLNLMKNPPAAMFVRQANVANGPQQVNNGVSAPAGKIENRPIEQLAVEQRDGSTQVDFGATTAPIDTHSNVAPLGAVKRTANAGGKGPCES
jgi:hypothetical protein